jgi:hypothetical protein
MRWRSVLVAASSCALLVAGCGGSPEHRAKPRPKIPADLAQQLAADADAVASTPGCAARDAAVKLQTDVISEIGRIPQRYREQLTSAANDVVSRIPECLPPKQDHGKHKGHGKHKKHDQDD